MFRAYQHSFTTLLSWADLHGVRPTCLMSNCPEGLTAIECLTVYGGCTDSLRSVLLPLADYWQVTRYWVLRSLLFTYRCSKLTGDKRAFKYLLRLNQLQTNYEGKCRLLQEHLYNYFKYLFLLISSDR
jgi:hypothetical protein